MQLDVQGLFLSLCGLEYRLLKYINQIQGRMAAPLNFNDAADALGVKWVDIRRAIKRLVDAKALIADGENFQINETVFKS